MIIEFIAIVDTIVVNFLYNASVVHNFNIDKERIKGDSFLKDQIRPSKLDGKFVEVVYGLVILIVEQSIDYKTSYNLIKQK